MQFLKNAFLVYEKKRLTPLYVCGRMVESQEILSRLEFRKGVVVVNF